MTISQDRILIGPFERLLWFAAFFFSIDAAIYMNSSADGFHAAGDKRSWISAALLALHLGASGYVLIVRRGRLPRWLVSDVFVYAPLFLAVMSAAWSEAPWETIKKSALYVAFTLFCVASYIRLGGIAAFQCLSRVLLAACLLSLLAVSLLPEYAISYGNHDGQWKGVFAHKNTLGAVAALAALLLFVRTWIQPRVSSTEIWGGLALSLTVILGAGALSPVVALLAASVAGFSWYRFSSLRRLYFLAGIAVIVLVGWVLSVTDLGYLAAYFGKDVSATGRVPLWEVTFADAAARWQTGYGYGAYWAGVEASSFRVGRAVGFAVAHAHSGYIEMALSFGILLTSFLIAAAAGRFIMFLRGSWAPRIQAALLAIVVFLVVFNISESAMMVASGAFWLCAVWMMLSWRDPVFRDRQDHVT